MKGRFSLFFGIEESTPSHITIRIFGIRFNILRSAIKKQRAEIKKYYHSFDSADKIPPASGGLRLIQCANAGFLDEFQKFLGENNLSYWIDFGTLLGAIRHKGFIPWDDDIDIAMKRDDYEKLIELLYNKDNNYNFELLFENNKRNKCFVKIKHKKSKNLFIDIFPYDFYHSRLNDKEKFELSENISLYTKKKPLFEIKNPFKLRQRFRKITEKFILSGKKADENLQPALFMGIDFPHKWKNKVYDYGDIFPLKKIPFENKCFLAPNDPEKVLKSIYNDYMKIPNDAYPRHSNYLDITEEEKAVLEGFIK